MVNIICGPVIGLVTSSVARVLIEVDQSVAIKMVLKHSGSGKTYEETLELTQNIPSVFQFDDLEEGSGYVVIVPDVGNQTLGEVRTLPADVTSLQIAAVSCDRPTSTFTCIMWDRLYKQGKRDGIHVVLHLGDNIYIDGEVFKSALNDKIVARDDIIFDPDKVDQSTAYVRARKVLRDLSQDQWLDKQDEILEIYRSEYRRIWGRKDKARVLANFSNLMILDDHDIRDDIGLMDDDSNPKSLEFFLGNIALQVYHEYQRQLWDPDVLKNRDSLKNEFYIIDIGPVRITMTDSRMTRSLYKGRRQPGDESYFGREQNNDVLKSFSTKGDTQPCLHLLVCTMPLIYMKRSVNKLLGKLKISDDMLDNINIDHQEELVGILDIIWKWQQAVAPSSECLMLAGDLHIGGFTDIYKDVNDKKELVCRQITTSPIQNQHFAFYQYAAVRPALSLTDKYKDYSYRHYDWVNKCNFAVISVDCTETLRYTVSLVSEEGVSVKKSWEPDWNGVANGSCCNLI